MQTIRAELASWHATHPDATLADMEAAVEDQLGRLRHALVDERTSAVRRDEHPACPQCGTTMVPRSRSTRTVTLPGEEALTLERGYVVCPACGTGLFPPG